MEVPGCPLQSCFVVSFEQLTDLLMDAHPGLDLMGPVTSHIVNVCICQIDWGERVRECENKWEREKVREQLSVSGWWLSDEIYVSTTVFLDVKLSFTPGFLQDIYFLWCTGALPTTRSVNWASLKTARITTHLWTGGTMLTTHGTSPSWIR